MGFSGKICQYNNMAMFGQFDGEDADQIFEEDAE